METNGFVEFDKKTNKPVFVNRGRKVGSVYARWWDVESVSWVNNTQLLYELLIKFEEFANERLQRRGYLFVNEIYEWFDFPKTKAGQVVGWIYDPERLLEDYVEFEIIGVSSSENMVFIDFNPRGNIWGWL